MQPNKDTFSSEELDLLVDKAVTGDAESFGSLYDLYVERIYRHLYFRVNNVNDAEDLTHQVFIKAWKAIRRYKRTSIPFIAWLLKIAQNLVIDFYRSKKDTDFLKPDFEIMSPDAGPQQQLEADFEQTRLRKTILQLQDEHQQVITMRFIDELSYEEIASALNKSEGAIRVIQHRALKKMREILEGEKDRD